MTTVKCDAPCKHSEDGVCSKDEIELDVCRRRIETYNWQEEAVTEMLHAKVCDIMQQVMEEAEEGD